MKLKLREGWQSVNTPKGFRSVERVGSNSIFAYAIIDHDGNVLTYRFGEFGVYAGEKCKSIEEAHAYLLSVGSESPWEEESMLKLRKGWETGKTDKCLKPECDWVYKEGENWESAYAQFMDEKVYVYPHGDRDHFEFNSIEEAHAYLLASGSESPWEEV